ncbi:MAG: diguanylate cyclase domain-containing protein [Desulfocucumaceae bacterium]
MVDFVNGVLFNEVISIVNNFSVMIYRCSVDKELTMRYVSEGCFNVTGYEQSDLVENKNISFKSLIHPGDVERVWGEINAAIKKIGFYKIGYRIIDAQGVEKDVLDLGRKVMSEGGELLAIEGLVVDITGIKWYKEKRQSVKNEFKNRALVDALPDLMFILGKDSTFLYYKEAKDCQLPIPPGNLLGKEISDVLPNGLARQILFFAEKALQTDEIQNFEFHLIFSGNEREYEARVVSSGEDEILVIIRDITYRKQMEKQLKYLNLHDPLTGLYNRFYFEQEMRRLEGGRQTIGIIMCDVDGLKLINDTLGHDTGDALLVAAARIIKRAFRRGDMVARIGGDEFAVLLPNSDRVVVERAVERIRNVIARYNAASLEPPLSISIGFSIRDGEKANVSNIFKEADNNMNREKLHRSQSVRSSIVQTLMKALEARDFITEGHAERLQGLVEKLAKNMGLADHSVTDLRLLARFHDLGKVGIPDRILFKAGPLTGEEFGEMKRHSEIGHRIAKSAPDLVPISDWILKHHEWWNGEGYPIGLRGEGIPLECRILSIADAYDAMTSDRPYRKALRHEAAVSELVKCSGSQFDPKLVSVFIQSFMEE